MTDKELLEMAAKAAGVEHEGFDEDEGRDVWWIPDLARYDSWNPLTDDGDALRLAVKLKIDVAHTNIHSPQVHALADAKIQVWEDSSTDPFTATRLAIVRAAAAIGKNMEAKP